MEKIAGCKIHPKVS